MVLFIHGFNQQPADYKALVWPSVFNSILSTLTVSHRPCFVFSGSIAVSFPQSNMYRVEPHDSRNNFSKKKKNEKRICIFSYYEIENINLGPKVILKQMSMLVGKQVLCLLLNFLFRLLQP